MNSILEILEKDELKNIRNSRWEHAKNLPYQKLYSLNKKLSVFKSSKLVFNEDEVSIGDSSEFNREEHKTFKECLELFIPWKKGPFDLFGNRVDSEWRSDWKWERIKKHCPNLEGKVIADIGCNNGYYMFRMLSENPKFVLGFEPFLKHVMLFNFLQSYVQRHELRMEPLGIEHCDFFEKTFDLIFCLGILYHHTDPVSLLRKMKESLKPGGHIIIDCQGIDDQRPISLCPPSSYAGAKGMWALPSESCLLNWIHRSGFRKMECFYKAPLSLEEQRSTEWAPIKSLKDFMSPSNPEQTVEGFPRPWRFYVKAQR